MQKLVDVNESYFLKYADINTGLNKNIIDKLGLDTIYLNEEALLGADDYCSIHGGDYGILIDEILNLNSFRLVHVSFMQYVDNPKMFGKDFKEQIFTFECEPYNMKFLFGSYYTYVSGCTYQLIFEVEHKFMLFHDPFSEIIQFASRGELFEKTSKACKRYLF